MGCLSESVRNLPANGQMKKNIAIILIENGMQFCYDFYKFSLIIHASLMKWNLIMKISEKIGNR